MRTANFFPFRISCDTLCVTFSANGAAIKKSKSSLLSDRTYEIGLFGTRHRWTSLSHYIVVFLRLGDLYLREEVYSHEAKDQFAGLDLNTGFVEAFYEGFQQLEELLKSVGIGCDVLRV